MTLSKSANLVAWVAQLVAAGILGMAGVLKLTGHPDSIAIFTTLGAEPWARYLVGVVELTSVVLLLRPAWARRGALLALALMAGAIGSHLTVLGIVFQDDGGALFMMALTVVLASVVVLRLRRPTG